MKCHLFILCATVFALSGNARADDLAALAKAATGEIFRVGETEFRMVQGVSVDSDNDQNRSSSSSSRAVVADSKRPDAIAHIGRYAISPRVGRVSVKSAIPATSQLGAAVNLRSGQPVLVAPRVKLFDVNPDIVLALAASTEGKVLYASSVDGAGLIGYASVDVALQAMNTIKGARGVGEASLDVIEGFARVR